MASIFLPKRAYISKPVSLGGIDFSDTDLRILSSR